MKPLLVPIQIKDSWVNLPTVLFIPSTFPRFSWVRVRLGKSQYWPGSQIIGNGKITWKVVPVKRRKNNMLDHSGQIRSKRNPSGHNSSHASSPTRTHAHTRAQCRVGFLWFPATTTKQGRGRGLHVILCGRVQVKIPWSSPDHGHFPFFWLKGSRKIQWQMLTRTTQKRNEKQKKKNLFCQGKPGYSPKTRKIKVGNISTAWLMACSRCLDCWH